MSADRSDAEVLGRTPRAPGPSSRWVPHGPQARPADWRVSWRPARRRS